MTRKTVTVFSATGVAGSACVEELLAQDIFNVRVLLREGNTSEKSSSGLILSGEEKQKKWANWQARGAELRSADINSVEELVPALEGTDYLVSCVPLYATESQYPLIYAAKAAGVERFVPSEFGFIYEWEARQTTLTVHSRIARQKVFIQRMIEMAGLDYTIIPAGLWPEYYMLEPVGIMGDGNQKFSWSTGKDVGRIIPHVLAHPASRNAVCPVAATAYCTWNELLDVRERMLGRKVERNYMNEAEWKAAYNAAPDGPMKTILGIGVAATEQPEGMPLWANWNGRYLPEFKGTPLEELFVDYIEPFTAAMSEAAS
ncbi:NmrA family NAD(P)-binding protein [Pseudomonas chengduensis]|uniref:NmrA family NAD(P)-binding protein n=1 Tax=Pseudomonas sediminis TaxID=1691904 RepID=UPI00244C4B00|nr:MULTISPECIES: NmrA family NAD(P)-binding protein [Pseudomonas]MDG9757906.1 NmrA family NAD(P)-binding protein [Pseudomonas sediminis]MDH0624850.1 NmrA family NAD(P)-binding protein [Pseudomonas chengduensis]MDH1664617.1 NmrA family NAD(P)-binding protein [Pseudomonas chengduensis]